MWRLIATAGAALPVAAAAIAKDKAAIVTESTPQIWHFLGYSPAIPPVPAEAKKPCTPTPMRRQPDGSANSADAEWSLHDARADLALCDLRRGLAVDAWPR